MFTRKCEAPGCGAMISFIDMQMGGKMPVDAEPVKMVVRPVDLPVSYVQAYINEEKYGRMVDVFIPHWHTCRDPGMIKRRKKAGKIKYQIKTESPSMCPGYICKAGDSGNIIADPNCPDHGGLR
jgi:hypothetical protein